MKTLLTLLSASLFGAAAHAVVLTTVPTQGSFPPGEHWMVHIDVIFRDQPDDTFMLNAGSVIPQLTPLKVSNPGDAFDPAHPWFLKLDPSQGGMAFSRRYGFLAMGDDGLPDGMSLGIRLIDSSAGLEIFHYGDTPGTEFFNPVFGTEGSQDHVRWDGTMWHPVFAAPAGTGTHFATFELFVANGTVNFLEYDQTASAVPGYETAQVTINFTIVPEPGTGILAMAGAGLLAMTRRRLRRGV